MKGRIPSFRPSPLDRDRALRGLDGLGDRRPFRKILMLIGHPSKLAGGSRRSQQRSWRALSGQHRLHRVGIGLDAGDFPLQPQLHEAVLKLSVVVLLTLPTIPRVKEKRARHIRGSGLASIRSSAASHVRSTRVGWSATAHQGREGTPDPLLGRCQDARGQARDSSDCQTALGALLSRPDSEASRLQLAQGSAIVVESQSVAEPAPYVVQCDRQYLPLRHSPVTRLGLLPQSAPRSVARAESVAGLLDVGGTARAPAGFRRPSRPSPAVSGVGQSQT